MKRLLSAASFAAALVLAAACSPGENRTAEPAASVPAAPAAAIPYGANKDTGATFVHDGVTLYYETYGQGEPLLLVHGNGGSIGTICGADRALQGEESDRDGQPRPGAVGRQQEPITYEKMTDDLAALIDHLKVGPVDVVGWSDGGIEALLLGVRHPDKVKKIVSMAANLNPGPEAFDPEIDALIKSMMRDTRRVKNTPEGKRQLKVVGMMLKEPNISPAAWQGHGADAGAGERQRPHPAGSHRHDLQEPAKRAAGDLPEQDAHDPVRRPRTVQQPQWTVFWRRPSGRWTSSPRPWDRSRR